MPTPEELLPVIAPELAGDASIPTLVEVAESQVGQVFGSQRDYAVANLLAHLLTMAKRSGDGGAVSGRSEGGVSINYVFGRLESELDATSYGKEFKRLRRMMVVGARTRIV